jgi:hypothetical protein
MSKVSNCPNCGASVEEGVAFCPQCGNKLQVAVAVPPVTPPTSAAESVAHERSRGFAEHLTIGYNVAISNPMVFLPAILGGVVSTIISFVSSALYVFGWLSIILGLFGTIFSFILSFASLDMSRDAYDKQALDLGSSINYVLKRFATFLVAAIFGALLSITIVLISAVILTFVIMVVDETGIMDAFGKAFKVFFADLGDVIVILLLAIVGAFVLGYIPFISTFLISALYVVISLAFIDLYINYKNK